LTNFTEDNKGYNINDDNVSNNNIYHNPTSINK